MAARTETLATSWRAIGAIDRRIGGKTFPAFEVETPDGRVRAFAPASSTAPFDEAATFRIKVNNKDGDSALASLDEYSIAMAFLHGDIDLSGDFLRLFEMRRMLVDRHPLKSILRFLRPLIFGQTKENRQSIPKHYDRGNDFYFAFLDKQHRLYSQALFHSESETLEQAADNKLRYICDVCRIGPGTRVLDVGAGWGSFSFHAARSGADVTMLTLSSEQRSHLQQRIDTEFPAGGLRVELDDVLTFDTRERFDAIVLLGVMEHLPRYSKLLARFEDLLEPDGRVYMDFSAIRRKFGISTFTYSQVFEGNGSPVYLPELVAAANDASYEVVAIHNDRHSYFLTLRSWAANLDANEATLTAKVGQSTFRLFQLYLWATAHSLGVSEELQAYRVVLQKSKGRPSSTVGL